MKKLIVVITALSSASLAHADLWTFDFLGGSADQGEELTAPVPSTAVGYATDITYNDVSNQLIVHANYKNLTSDVRASHVHGAAAPATNGGPGSNAGVAFDLSNTGGTSGDLSGSAFLSEAQEKNLLAGRWYVNVHTRGNPGGEIRGQLIPTRVPDSSTTLALALIGFGSLCLYRSRS